jgi:hypothetical protein
MAARLNRRHQDSVRAKIQATQLINLLQANAEGKLENELSAGRIQSVKILLDKSISNAPTIIAGDEDSPLSVNVNLSGLSDEQVRAIASIQINGE